MTTDFLKLYLNGFELYIQESHLPFQHKFITASYLGQKPFASILRVLSQSAHDSPFPGWSRVSSMR